MRTAKTLIRMSGCPGWSESSLDAQSLCWFCHVAAQMLTEHREFVNFVENSLKMNIIFFLCHVYEDLRNERLPYKYIHHPNRNKFNILMSSNNETIIKAVVDYLCKAFNLRKQLLAERLAIK